VCGINPHAGENGLFGHGEEEEKIIPAVEALRADPQRNHATGEDRSGHRRNG
jgi:4-hydroxy-L-threonine phosphate dehydrogenase PdxA